MVQVLVVAHIVMQLVAAWVVAHAGSMTMCKSAEPRRWLVVTGAKNAERMHVCMTDTGGPCMGACTPRMYAVCAWALLIL